MRAPDLGEAALADCVILPLPAAGEGGRLNAPLSQERPPLTQVLDALRPGQVVCAGKVGRELLDQAKERGLRLVDYAWPICAQASWSSILHPSRGEWILRRRCGRGSGRFGPFPCRARWPQ